MSLASLVADAIECTVVVVVLILLLAMINWEVGLPCLLGGNQYSNPFEFWKPMQTMRCRKRQTVMLADCIVASSLYWEQEEHLCGTCCSSSAMPPNERRWQILYNSKQMPADATQRTVLQQKTINYYVLASIRTGVFYWRISNIAHGTLCEVAKNQRSSATRGCT